jgi:hypothetical protein
VIIGVMDIFEWTSPLVVPATVGDLSGGLRWLPFDVVQTGEVAESRLADVDTTALPMAG